MAQRILKNQTDSVIAIDDLGAKEIPAYGQIDFAQSFSLAQLSNSEDLVIALTTDVVNGFSTYLILNDGVEDLEAADAIDLIRNIYQRTNLSSDGDFEVVTKKPALLSTNRVIDKMVAIVLEAQSEYFKKFIIPSGQTWVIENFGSGCDQATTKVCLNYYNDDGIVENIFVNPIYDQDTTLNQQALAADLVLTVNNFNGELSKMDNNKHYKFVNYNDHNQQIIRKVVNIDIGNNTITLDQALGVDFPIGSYLSLIEKPLRSLIVEKVTNVLEFSSPIIIEGTGSNSLCLYLCNLDEIEDSSITAFFNGYQRPTGA